MVRTTKAERGGAERRPLAAEILLPAHGTAFHVRGAHNVTMTGCEVNHSGNGLGNGANKGSVHIEDAPLNAGGSFSHSVDVFVNSGNDINSGAQNGIYVDDGSSTNIRIGGNDIIYDDNPYYGMKKTSRTPVGQLTYGSTTFHPNNPTWNRNF